MSPLRRLLPRGLRPSLPLAGFLALSALVMPGPQIGLTHGSASRADLNPIQIENSRPGTTGWIIDQDFPTKYQIGGYGSRQSVYPGQEIGFSVSTTAPRFTAEIYRIGWYGGEGGRLMLSLPSMPGYSRTIPKPKKGTGLIVCNWPVSFSFTVPGSWTTGMYLVKLTTGYENQSYQYQSYIPFVVKEAKPRAPLLVIDTVTTSQAYNWWGGKSLYADIHYKSAAAQLAHRAVMVSFDRPYAQNDGAGWFLTWEIHLVRWLERKGYDVAYADDLDVNDDPGMLLHYKGILITGHDEYWSLAIRNAMDNAVAHGVSLANFAANSGYWQIRFGRLGSDPDGIQICYKSLKRDPYHKTDPKLTTVEWRQKPVDRPESELFGAMYQDYEGRYAPSSWVVRDPNSWIFAGTHVRKGTSVTKLVGVEEDSVLAGYRHARHLTIVAASPVYNNVHQRRISESTIYRASSGAWVFDGSTMEWASGLDDYKKWWWDDNPWRGSPSPIIERVTSNILNAFLHDPSAP